LNHRNCNSFLNFPYYLSYHLFLNYLFNYLWNFNNLLNNSRDNYYFLDYLFYLNDFRNFHHFLNDFLNLNPDLLDSFYYFRNLNDSFLDLFNYFWDLNVVINNLFYLNYPWLIDNKRLPNFNLFNCNNIIILNYWNLDNLFDYFDYFMNHRNIDIFLNLVWNFLYLLNDVIYYFLNFFNPLLYYNFLNYLLYFHNLYFSFYNLNYFVSESFHFNDSLYDSVYINWLLDDLFNDSVLYSHMISDL
jgi:hypothetical protein